MKVIVLFLKQGSMDKNPPASIETSIDEFQLSISYLYQGNVNVAWLRPPKVGDYIEFKFHEPTLLKRFFDNSALVFLKISK